MITYLRTFRTFFILLALFLSACAGIPVQEMSDARQAVEAARSVGAATHAPAEMQLAEELLREAEQALTVRDYRTASERAKAAHAQAINAQKKSLDQQ